MSLDLYAAIRRWEPLVEKVAPRYLLDVPLVLGVIAQESSGDPYAWRAEPGFWRRYSAGVIANVRATVWTLDDPWLKYPDIISASFGLMQVLWPVAIERGRRPRTPFHLFEPEENITTGCSHLSTCRGRVRVTTGKAIDHPEVTRGMLLRYNGGGDPHYPERITGWMDRLAA